MRLVGLMLLGLLPLRGAAQPAEGPDTLLQARLERLVDGFRGDVGVYVRHLPSGRTAAVHADEVFPSASLIKVPILVALYERLQAGELVIDQPIVYRDTLIAPGTGLLGAFRDGEMLRLDEAAWLMTSLSDNTAALLLQRLAGTGTAINDWLADHDFRRTRVNAATPGRYQQWRQYNWGQTTPREMADLLVMIREGRAVSPAASEAMYRALTRSFWTDVALSQLPSTVQAASKQGNLPRSRSEVVLVNAPHGDYVFCVITKDQEDERPDADNEGFALIRAVSALLWNHFEPASAWHPSEGRHAYGE